MRFGLRLHSRNLDVFRECPPQHVVDDRVHVEVVKRDGVGAGRHHGRDDGILRLQRRGPAHRGVHVVDARRARVVHPVLHYQCGSVGVPGRAVHIHHRHRHPARGFARDSAARTHVAVQAHQHDRAGGERLLGSGHERQVGDLRRCLGLRHGDLALRVVHPVRQLGRCPTHAGRVSKDIQAPDDDLVDSNGAHNPPGEM